MPPLGLYLAFVGASAALIAMPGPNAVLIMARTLSHGRRAGFATLIGTWSGAAAQLAIVVAGLTAIAVTLADVIDVIRWLGAAWLVAGRLRPVRRLAGEVLFDEAYAAAADVDASATAASPGGSFETMSGGLRRAVFTGFDGRTYLLLANFGSMPLAVDHAEATDLATGASGVRTLLEPAAACVLRKQ